MAHGRGRRKIRRETSPQVFDRLFEFRIAAGLLHFLLMFNLIHENKTRSRKTEDGRREAENGVRKMAALRQPVPAFFLGRRTVDVF
jgi:cytochrome bd-type quinol oxidase subunit 1